MNMTKPTPTISHHIQRHLRNRFVSGILVLVPLVLTYFILAFLFKTFSGFMLPLLKPLTGDLPHYVVVLLALVATLAVVYMVGLITNHFLGRKLLRLGEAIILKLPIAKSIYGASKQIVDVFAAGNNSAFKAVVIVEFPHAGSLGIGFATGHIKDEKGLLHYTVFIPTTPNPTSGYLIMVPAGKVRFTSMPIEEGIKMIVSGGVLSPDQFNLATQVVMEAVTGDHDALSTTSRGKENYATAK
jgi:uncharacterized membrane protein